MDQLRRDLQSISSRLNALSVGQGKKKGGKRNKRKGAGQQASLPAAMSTAQVVGSGSGRRKRNKASAGNNAGVCRMSRMELLGSITSTANTTSTGAYFDLVPDSFKFLKGLFRSFEQLKWHRLAVYWRPAVGTNVGGLVTYGFDYSFTLDSDDRTKVAALTPVKTHALYLDTSGSRLGVPAERLRTRPWWVPSSTAADAIDKGPGRLCYAITHDAASAAKVLGEFWVDYDVTLAGTHA